MSAKDSKDQPDRLPGSDDKPAGYRPSLGRKLFMLGLCIVGLIVVWTYYFKTQAP